MRQTSSPAAEFIHHVAAGVTPPPSVPLHRYVSEIHRIRSLLNAGDPYLKPSKLHAIVRAMESLRRVRLADGRTITTDLPQWATQLTTRSRDARSVVIHRIDDLDRALLTLNPQHLRHSEMEQLDQILRDAAFHPRLNPIQQIEQWLGGMIARLLRLLLHSSSVRIPPLDRIGTIAIAAAFLLVVAGIAFVISQTALRRATPSVHPYSHPADPISPDGAQRLAGETASAGNYREALRYLFLATLLELRDAGLLQLRPGDTNREYLASLRERLQDPARQHALAALVDEFDNVWYGHRTVTPDDYERCLALAARIVPFRGRAA